MVNTPLPSGVPLGTPSAEGVYLAVYPSSCPNTDTVYPLGFSTYCLITFDTAMVYLWCNKAPHMLVYNRSRYIAMIYTHSLRWVSVTRCSIGSIEKSAASNKQMLLSLHKQTNKYWCSKVFWYSVVMTLTYLYLFFWKYIKESYCLFSCLVIILSKSLPSILGLTLSIL